MTRIAWWDTVPMPFIELSDDDQQKLLSLARESIQVRLLFDRDLHIDETTFSPALQQLAACFVTLRKKGTLRGCVGTLEASRPLVTNVVHHAAASAFEDPRFPAVNRDEEAELQIEISVLTEPTPMSFNSETELIEQLVPERDGLIIEKGSHRATFLPTVWSAIPDKASFLKQLKRKAGLADDFWSDNLKAWRYDTTSFEE